MANRINAAFVLACDNPKHIQCDTLIRPAKPKTI